MKDTKIRGSCNRSYRKSLYRGFEVCISIQDIVFHLHGVIAKYTIRNEFLEVDILRKGAELCSVRSSSGTEFMWQAEAVWPRHAPNLFPIVGSLIEHKYTYQGKEHPLMHHGFARDLDFNLLHQSEHSACFVLESNDYTFSLYPFRFTFLVTYTLNGRSLEQKYRVINRSGEEMPVSFGGHPAFNATPITDYFIAFSDAEEGYCNTLEGPYIAETQREVIKDGKIVLDRNIFNDDALVFIHPKSRFVSLQHKHSDYAVKVDISEFPYLGIWAKPGADYVCIEPWQGLADRVGHDQRFENKEGILILGKGEEVSRKFQMEFID